MNVAGKTFKIVMQKYILCTINLRSEKFERTHGQNIRVYVADFDLKTSKNAY